jgi:hypothetical protein
MFISKNINGLVHGNGPHLIKGPLETTGLKKGAAGTAGDQHCARIEPQTRKEEMYCYTPLGHSGRLALRREQCDVFDRRPSLLCNTPVAARQQQYFLGYALHGNQQ